MYKEFTVAQIHKSERKHKSIPLYLTNKGAQAGRERIEVETTFVITDTLGNEYVMVFHSKASVQRVYPHQILRCYINTSGYAATKERPRITRLFTKQAYEENIGKRIGYLQEINHNNMLEMETLKGLLK